MEASEVVLSFDGSIPKNPGPEIHWGWVLFRGRKMVDGQSGGHLHDRVMMTVHDAEYAGLLNGLGTYELLHARRGDHLTVIGDSQVVLYQVAGRYKANAPHLLRYQIKARDLLSRLYKGSVFTKLEWVPRASNVMADRMSR